MSDHPLHNDTIKGIIWDLDGTLYRFDEVFLEACNLAAARAAVDLGVPLKLEEAIEFAWKSHEDTGQSILHFLSDYGVAAADMHKVYHDFIDETLIKAAEETSDFFRKMEAELSIRHMILTHASRDWAVRALTHLGLKDFFPDDRIVAKEDYNFQSKCTDIEPFEMGLNVLGTQARETLVVEDTLKNLKPAHDHGFHTVFFHHGRKPDPVPDYAHHLYPNVLDFFEEHFD